MKTKPLTIAIIISCLLWSFAVLAQENYIIVSNSSNDSLFCSKHCPFFDFDQNAIINGSTIPDQFVEYQNDSLIHLQTATKLFLESTFGYDPEGVILWLYVMVDTMGVARGIITKVSNNEIPRLAAQTAFDYLKTKRFSPATLRGNPIPYGFPIVAKTANDKKQKQGLFKHQK